MAAANNSPVFDEPSIAGAAIGQEFASRPLIFSLARILAFSGGDLAEPGWRIATSTRISRRLGKPASPASSRQGRRPRVFWSKC